MSIEKDGKDVTAEIMLKYGDNETDGAVFSVKDQMGVFYLECESGQLICRQSVPPVFANEFRRLQKIEWCVKEQDVDLTAKPEQPVQEYSLINKNSVMRFALKTIAEWPVSDIMHMDSMNMIKVAKDALAATPEPDGLLAELAIKLIHDLDKFATNEDGYEYGLPMYHHTNEMVKMVLDCFAKLPERESGCLTKGLEDMEPGCCENCRKKKWWKDLIEVRAGLAGIVALAGNPPITTSSANEIVDIAEDLLNDYLPPTTEIEDQS